MTTTTHNYETGMYNIHVYTNSTFDGSLTYTPKDYTRIDRAKPNTSGFWEYESGIPNTAGVADFATWTRNNGQDDITWGGGGFANNVFYKYTSIADHNNEKLGYFTHAYYLYNNSTTNRQMDCSNFCVNTSNSVSQTTHGYVSSGMKLYLDGIDNNGTGGDHSSSNSLWQDLSGNNFSGILNGYESVDLSNVWGSSYLNFYGNQSVNTEVFNTSTITLEAVVSTNTLRDLGFDNGINNEQTIIANYEQTGCGLKFGSPSSTKKYNFLNYASANTYTLYDTNTAVRNKIYYIAATCDGTTSKFYVNGQLVATDTTGGVTSAANNSIWAIGGNPMDGATVNKYFNGRIYSVRMYNRALSSTEITSNYNNDVTRFGVGTDLSLPSTDETQPYMPEGFTWIPTTSLNTGLTIKNAKGSQFTWIEVPKSITASCTTDTAIETALRSYSSAYNTQGTVSSGDVYYSGCGLTESDYNNYKSKMLNSIRMYGGFWVSSYEIGSMTSRITSEDTLTTPYSIGGMYPYNYVTVTQAETISEQVMPTNYNSSLLFGVQWNLVCKYLEVKGAKTQSLINSNSSTWGNYKDVTFSITSGSYSTNLGTGWTAVSGSYTKPATYVLLTTGATTRNSTLNIYDLSGNISEWTLEKASTSGYPCASRGGDFYVSGTAEPTSYRHFASITESFYIYGFRTTIY